MSIRRLLWMIAIAGGVSFGAHAATPLSLSVANWTLPESADVWGLHFSPVSFVGTDYVEGLSVGVVDSMVYKEVSGIQLSGLISYVVSSCRPTTVSGCQIAGLTSGCDRFYGSQMSGIFSGTDEGTGLQLTGLFSMVGKSVRGVQIAGLLSAAEKCRGAQIALYNSSASMCGLQIGLLNFAVPSEDGWVVQLGLVNGIGRDENAGWLDGMRYLPVVNVGW